MHRQNLYGIVGNPVLHSLSPGIYNSLFEKFKIQAHYIRLAGVSAAETVAAASAIGMKGFNVTSPYKQDIIKHMDDLGGHARRLEAVNTVISKGSRWLGYNTDFIGAVEALKANKCPPFGKKVVILGAGGAARAAAYGLIRSGASQIILMNRTEQKARAASAHLGCGYVPIEKSTKILSQADILVSCIPSSQNSLDLNDLSESCVILDADYRKSHFTERAANNGFQVINGKEWLYHQALPAFRLFTGLTTGKIFKNQAGRSQRNSLLPEKSSIALVGFMGSGKTSVGRALAQEEGMEFVDIDTEIEKAAGTTIKKIFSEKGEPAFREMEKAVLQETLAACRKSVISLGGGAVLDKENRSRLRKSCRIVWLWVSARTACARIDPSTRPLFPAVHAERRMEKLLQKRIPFYAGICDLAVCTEKSSPQAIAGRIIDEMDQAL